MKISSYLLLILFFVSINISASTKEKLLDYFRKLNISSFKKIPINKRDLKFYIAGIVSPILVLLLLVPFH